jgi:site-specific DNA-methyltransferase (adenine-specific)
MNIKNGDSLELLKDIKSDTVDCMVTDPPYGISFMNKDWDKAVPDIAIWKECLRVMKPGAFAFVMCSPRSDVQAEMIIKLKEAGFEVGFSPIYWVYVSGFPKSMNISKAVDRKRGYSSEEAERLSGSYAGFQPKPAVEVIIVAMKPLSEKTYVDQALKNGKGITWLNDGRIPYQSDNDKDGAVWGKDAEISVYGWAGGKDHKGENDGRLSSDKGRFPANLLVQDDILDIGVNKPSKILDISRLPAVGKNGIYGHYKQENTLRGYDDSGDLSRYFSLDAWYSKNIEDLPDYVQRIFPFLYVPKASKSEREKDLDDLPETSSINGDKWTDMDRRENNKPTLRRNFHPTVKPLRLMSYLVTIGSRPGDTILDPFMGSGTTGVAAKILHRDFVGFEIEGKYFEIAKARIDNHPATRNIFEFDYDGDPK